MTPDPFQLWCGLRYLHLVGAAVLIGGAVTISSLLLLARCADSELTLGLPAAVAYEWVFWSMVGLVVATGVGNLGMKKDGLPGIVATWGHMLQVKLLVVGSVLMLSLVRTDFVARCQAINLRGVPLSVLGSLYLLTAGSLLFALWIGLGLGHGRY